MVALPAFTYDPKTKVNAETMVYAIPYPGQILDALQYRADSGTLHKASDINANGCCGGECPCPPVSFNATVTQNANKAPIGGLPINSPLYSAVTGLINPTGDGDSVYHVCLPEFSEMTLICFDQGVSPTIGHNQKPIGRKFLNVDHRVRQKTSDTISLSDLFVSNWDGLSAIRGIPSTIAVLVTPDGIATQQITFYSNVVINPMTPSHGSDENESITLTFEGDINFIATFSAPKP